MIRKLVLVVAFLLSAIVTGFFVYGPRDVWIALNPDLVPPPVNFVELRRSETPNDALVCPIDYCGQATPDIVSPVYALNAAVLAQELRDSVPLSDDLLMIDERNAGLRLLFIRYTPILQFPDIITVECIGLDEKRSTIAIYAKARLGGYDFGNNLALVKQWLALISRYEETNGVQAWHFSPDTDRNGRRS